MKTLYDILGVRPGDDDAEFKRAFRKAVKASHPDLHADDPDAPSQFRQVVQAYSILRDPEMRAAYDQLLDELEREQQLRATPRRYTIRKFAFDGMAAASLAAAMAFGYALLADISPSFNTAKVVTMPWLGPAKITAVQPAAPTNTTDQGEPRDKLASVEVSKPSTASSGTASAEGALTSGTVGGVVLANAHGGTASSAAFGAAVDQAHAKAATDHLNSDSATEPLDQTQRRAVGRQFSVERITGIPRSSSLDLARSHQKNGMKPRAMKTSGRPRIAVKRQAAHQLPSKHVSLENKSSSACAGSPSCSRDVPPLFGVGF
jgi:curved DNA-binding protein CbpA